MALNRLYDVWQSRRIENLPPFDPERTDYTVQQLDDYATAILQDEKRTHYPDSPNTGHYGHWPKTLDGPRWLSPTQQTTRGKRELAVEVTGIARPELGRNFHAPYVEKASRRPADYEGDTDL